MNINDNNAGEFDIVEVISSQCIIATKELLTEAKLHKGDVVVVGCSTSEIMKQRIGTSSNAEIGKVVFNSISHELSEEGIYIAAQCCEHLNRAIVIEKEAARKYGYEEVNVRPVPKAGGSFATAAYENMKEPVVIEEIRAHAGIDIGDTFIGMHLKRVAVPVVIETNTIGYAHVTCARTRPKYIGGERANYNAELG